MPSSTLHFRELRSAGGAGPARVVVWLYGLFGNWESNNKEAQVLIRQSRPPGSLGSRS